MKTQSFRLPVWRNFVPGQTSFVLPLKMATLLNKKYEKHLEDEGKYGVEVDCFKSVKLSENNKELKLCSQDDPSAFSVYMMRLDSKKWPLAHKCIILVRICDENTDNKSLVEKMQWTTVYELEHDINEHVVFQKVLSQLFKMTYRDAELISEYLNVFTNQIVNMKNNKELEKVA
jgi:hypothetical protein